MDTSKKLTKLQMKETQNYWKPRTIVKAATGKSLTYKGKLSRINSWLLISTTEARRQWDGTCKVLVGKEHQARILQESCISKTLLQTQRRNEYIPRWKQFVAIQSALQEIPMEIPRDERKGHQTGIKSIWTKDISTSNYTGTSLYPFFWI